MKFNRIILVSISLLVFLTCTSVPITGRKQLTQLVSNSELLQMSFNQYSKVLSESKLSNNKTHISQVKRVGKRIQKAVEKYFENIEQSKYLQNFKWEFNVIEQDVINAWCMPGGKVVFYSGILPVCGSDNGVAVVMGHEIAHAIANHGQERMNLQLIKSLGGMGLSVALKEQPKKTQSLANLAFGIGSNLGIILPYSRKHESESDKIGLIFMAMAGYNPKEAPLFWKRMQSATSKKTGNKTPRFLSTHPLPEDRIKALNQQMPEAIEIYNKYSKVNK